MAHLRPEQFVDIVDGVIAEAGSEVAPHLSTCAACRQQLVDLRATMAEAADVVAPEPSPLFWDQLSARVHEAVAEEAARRPSWREWLLQPRVWAPVLAGALAVVLFVVRQPQTSLTPSAPQPQTNATIPAAPLPVGDAAAQPSAGPLGTSLPPLGSTDDPQLGLIASVGTALSWDEMRDEIAFDAQGASTDAVLDSLTVDEQRELQRLLADEMTQPAVPEIRS